MRYIQQICQHFQSLCNDYFGIKVGKVYSAYSLTPEQIQKIENAISQKEAKKVQLRDVYKRQVLHYFLT